VPRATDLQYFLTRYLGQDWDVEGDTYTESVEAAIAVEPRELLRNVQRGIRRMLAEHHSDDSLRTAAMHEGMAYAPAYDQMSYRAFLEHIVEQLEAGIGTSSGR
jgi:hypothetical protein